MAQHCYFCTNKPSPILNVSNIKLTFICNRFRAILMVLIESLCLLKQSATTTHSSKHLTFSNRNSLDISIMQITRPVFEKVPFLWLCRSQWKTLRCFFLRMTSSSFGFWRRSRLWLQTLNKHLECECRWICGGDVSVPSIKPLSAFPDVKE